MPITASQRRAGSPSSGPRRVAPPGRAKAASRGTIRRRLRRRAFRRWCSSCKQERLKGPGPPQPALPKPLKAAQTRAAWFRNCLYWQESLRRRKGRKPVNFPTATPLSYDCKFKFGTINVQGMADTLKLKTAIQLMREHKLGVLLLSETKSTSYYSYTSEGHLVILSGNPKDRYAGVGAIISPKLRPHLLDVIQVSNRIIHLSFKKQGGNFHVIGVYGPHSGLDLEETRAPFWDQLETQLSNIPQPEPVYVTGDFNVRFRAAHKNDGGVTGPFTHGKGARYIDHNASSNRTLCVNTMSRINMVEAASYRTPCPIHHITYKDKAAPPKDWSQYLLDPLIMQQVYDKMHFELDAAALPAAALVRSFLDMPSPLPPPKTAPHVDPTLFQRLDHCFTRRQWLNTVNHCQSKLHTGFPSDHYLLVTEIQVKLAARVDKPPRPPKLNIKLTADYKREFNAILKDLLEDTSATADSDHNATSNQEGPVYTVYTDGSGSSGKCSRHTAAGWGFCYLDNDTWKEAYGPVITTPDSPQYRGAQVGSNNTGELTAIIEAVMYAHQEGWSRINIRSDSQWAIKVITGQWRAKHHKTLVNLAKRIVQKGTVKVHLEWVKGHSGVEGNEKADALAEKGKQTSTRQGTAAPVPEEKDRQTQINTSFSQRLQEAADQTFQKQQLRPRRPWISETTLQALSEARTAEALQEQNAQQLRNKAKRLARKDRVNWVHSSLMEDTSQEKQQMWNVIRRQKKGFQGRKGHLLIEGKPVPWSQTHVAFRTHLESKQWKFPVHSEENLAILKSRKPLREQSTDHNAFTLEELQTAIFKLKKGKASGPEGVQNELFLLSDDDNIRLLLDFYNAIWEKGEVPADWKEAIVVSIYKGKGVDTDPANYRPISLLNSIYKVFASMLQSRLSAIHESHLRQTQYGFRAGRSTQHPLFILRRVMEWSEMTSTTIHPLFLDWKQAFDSVDHNALIVGLRRFGVSDKALKIISSLYQDPTFYTTSQFGDRAKGGVGSGIRQGCPLSPYLFIMLLTVIFEDVDWALLSDGIATNTWSVGKPVYDLEYADDTLLLALTTTQLQAMLQALEEQAYLYGMSLNQTKTEILADPRKSPPKVKFRSGEAVPTTTLIKYLGSMITWEKPFEAAFKHRAGIAETNYKKLRLIWNCSLTRKEKLHIFQTTFIPTLIYGLDSLTLQDKHLKRIDAYYYRFLRRIIGIKASYYSRITNNEVWRRARYPRKPSSFLNKAQAKFLDSVFATSDQDPVHHVVFSPGFKDRIQAMGRRRGGKVPYWIEVTTRRFYKEHWNHHLVRGTDHNAVYHSISRALRTSGHAPMRARNMRARH